MMIPDNIEQSFKVHMPDNPGQEVLANGSECFYLMKEFWDHWATPELEPKQVVRYPRDFRHADEETLRIENNDYTKDKLMAGKPILAFMFDWNTQYTGVLYDLGEESAYAKTNSPDTVYPDCGFWIAPVDKLLPQDVIFKILGRRR